MAAGGIAGAQNVVHFAGTDSGVALRPNSNAAAAALDSAALMLGDGVLHIMDFEGVPLGTFLNLTPAQTGIPGFSILGAAESGGNDTAISNEVFVAEGFNTTLGGANYLKIEENQPGPGVEPEVGVTFAFARPIVAFGAYITGADPSVRGYVTAVFDNGQQHTILLDGQVGGGTQFWGFTDSASTGISRVTFLSSPENGINTDAFGIDDVRWVHIPEPGSVLLFVAALVFMGRRQR
jgi:hypothetical protein